MLRLLFVVGGSEGAPENRLDAQHIKETASDLCDVRVDGDTLIDHHCTTDAVSRHTGRFLEQLAGLTNGCNLGVSERVMREARRAQLFPSDDQLVLSAHGKGSEEHSLDERKHHRRSGDAQRKRHHRGSSEGPSPPQAAACESEALVQCVDQRRGSR